MTRLWLFIFALLPTFAHADGLIRPALGYTIDKTESGGSATTTTRQLIDIGGGYVTDSGVMLLGMYSTETKTVASSSSTTNFNRSSYGGGIGWMAKQSSGPYVDGIYFLDATMTSNSSTYKGNGWQIDVGYNFEVSRVGIGMQLTYRSFTYSKLNGSTLNNPYKQTNLDPMFAVLITF